MVFVIAFSLDIEISFCTIGKRFEEMEEHFRRHFTDHFPIEICIPLDPVAATKIDRNLCQ